MEKYRLYVCKKNSGYNDPSTCSDDPPKILKGYEYLRSCSPMKWYKVLAKNVMQSFHNKHRLFFVLDTKQIPTNLTRKW